MLIYIVLFAISAYLVYNFLLKSEEKSSKSNEKVVLKTNVNYDGANVMTAKGPGNICVAIFKNPVDHKTHFYRTRLKGKIIYAKNKHCNFQGNYWLNSNTDSCVEM